MENKPPYTITDKMLNYVSDIMKKIGEANYFESLNRYPELRRKTRIRSIHSSLAIENNQLSLFQVEDVINGKMVVGEQKDIQEVKNAYKAYEEIDNINPYSEKDLKKIQGILTLAIEKDSGKYRNHGEAVYDGDIQIFMAPPHTMVPSLMGILFDWMNEAKKDVNPLILSSIFHYEFVFIHPFSDGNGRMARLWHTVILSKWNPIFEYIPIESQIEKFQSEYYETIATCHVKGKSDIFIEFMLQQIDRILNEVIEQARNPEEQLSEYVKKLLSVMDFDVPYSTKSIMELLGLKSRETFRKNYLDPALERGVVIRTIPDKPNSKNQRYVRK